MSRIRIATGGYLTYSKFACGILIVLAFCGAHPASTAYAIKRKPAKYGTIRIRTLPGGFPLEVDGKSYGETAIDDRSFDLEPGLHTILIGLPNGEHWRREITLPAGRIKCVALNYRPLPPLPPKSFCPFPVSLSAPSQVNEGEIVTYTADVAYSGSSALTYTWTMSPASSRILGGAGTATITVDSTGQAGQHMTATLAVNDNSGNPICSQTAQASTFIPTPPSRVNPAREFDVCRSCSFDDQKARLDNLAIELQHDLSTTTQIVAYGGRNSRVGQANRLGARAKDYLVAKRGIDSSRISILNGGLREEEYVELWIVPSGAMSPQPTPTVPARAARPMSHLPGRRGRR